MELTMEGSLGRNTILEGEDVGQCCSNGNKVMVNIQVRSIHMWPWLLSVGLVLGIYISTYPHCPCQTLI